jgi:hypothetical protein
MFSAPITKGRGVWDRSPREELELLRLDYLLHVRRVIDLDVPNPEGWSPQAPRDDTVVVNDVSESADHTRGGVDEPPLHEQG